MNALLFGFLYLLFVVVFTFLDIKIVDILYHMTNSDFVTAIVLAAITIGGGFLFGMFWEEFD